MRGGRRSDTRGLRRLERVFCERLVVVQKAGQLAEGVRSKPPANLVITVLQGILVMSRVGIDRYGMRDAVTNTLSGVMVAGKSAAPGKSRAKTKAAAGRNRGRGTSLPNPA